ncbi:hypothetical protein UlMin_033549 [Ulmus minor]
MDQCSKKPLARGRNENGLYKLPVITSQDSKHNNVPSLNKNTVSAFTLSTDSSETWHDRLGHVSSVILQKVLSNCNLSCSINKNLICSSCQYAKSHRLPFQLSHSRASSPLDLIHTDIWGPAPVLSTSGSRYFILFVDDNTRFTWLFPLQTKDQALQVFIQFRTLVENQFNSKIKLLQSDNGGEFKVFARYLQANGIAHRFSCPYTSAQNGRVERKHRHVVETGLSLLARASLPLKYWLYAFQTAVHLINRMPTKVLDFASPYSVLLHKNPDYTLLKIFGCLCFPFIRPFNKHKLQFRSIECVFLGYSTVHKGYLCLDYQSGRVYITRHIVFDESKFPLASHSSSVAPATSPTVPTPALVTLPLRRPISISQSAPVLTDSHDHSPATTSEHAIPSDPSTSHSSSPAIPQLVQPVLPSSVAATRKMVTRSQNGIVKKKQLFLATRQQEPTTVKQAMKDSCWVAAMQKEIEALQRNHTWDLVDPPSDVNIIGCKWVFKLKYRADGTLERHKARLVAKGYNQTQGLDFFDTFSPVVKPATIKIVLTIALTFGWKVRQLDVQNAFLNGDLEENVYMSQPPGFSHSQYPHKLCKLRKALYGLKQAPRAWFTKLNQALVKWGFICSRSDGSMFLKFGKTDTLIVLVYVDDILVTGSSPTQIDELITQLHSSFAMRDLGQISYFLGIEVIFDGASIHLSQTRYIADLLTKTEMLDCKPAKTPGVIGKTLSQYDGEPFDDQTKYRSLVGALQYVTLTRPDIAFAVNKACQFMHNPTTAHWLAAKRILRYLRGTMQQGLRLNPSSHLQIQTYADADYASTPDDRRSSSGYCLFLGDNLVSWSATKQKVVSRSSAESEYRGLAIAAAEIVWTLSLLKELCIPQTEVPILWFDNISSSYMAANPVFHARSKHIEVDIHFIRDLVLKKQLQLCYVPTEDQLADLLTKHLSSSRFDSLKSRLCIMSRPFSLRGDESYTRSMSSAESCPAHDDLDPAGVLEECPTHVQL